MLTDSLRSMEEDGLVTRRVYPEVPPRVEYSLSPLGESMRPIIAAMEQWGAGLQGKQNIGKAFGWISPREKEVCSLASRQERPVGGGRGFAPSACWAALRARHSLVRFGGIGAPAGQSASVTPVILNTRRLGASLSDSQVCAAAVNSVVSINTTSQAGGGIFSASRCSPPPAALGLFSAAMATSSPTIMW